MDYLEKKIKIKTCSIQFKTFVPEPHLMFKRKMKITDLVSIKRRVHTFCKFYLQNFLKCNICASAS